jgi:hypothetical protein
MISRIDYYAVIYVVFHYFKQKRLSDQYFPDIIKDNKGIKVTLNNSCHN